MRSELRWLTAEDLITLNQFIVEATGEPFGIRDRGLLESACAKPAQHWHYDEQADIASLATTLLFGVAQNHPFLQGNKRTGLEAAVVFLIANGWAIPPGADAAMGDMIIAALGDDSRQMLFAEFVRDCIERRPALEP